MKQSGFCILFICQPGELEIKSLLLAYSIRKYLSADRQVFAAIPALFSDQLSPETLPVFSSLGIEYFFFPNPYMENRNESLPGDWMSNKYYSLLHLDTPSDILFFDSDIICTSNAGKLDLSEYSLALKPADRRPSIEWKALYKKAGLAFPSELVRTTVDNIAGPPYFNTGVIYMANSIRLKLCIAWQKYFEFLSDGISLDNLRFDPFHRDQFAFSLALKESGERVHLLKDSYNFPIRLRKIFPEDALFIHYHDVFTFGKYIELRNLFKLFIDDYPDIRSILKKYRKWWLASRQGYRLLTLAKIARKLVYILKGKY